MRDVPPDVRRRELGGPDPIDRRLRQSGPPSPLAPIWSLLMTRSALGMTPALTPAVIFLSVGFVMGPGLLGWISPVLLDRLSLAVTIALAVLGVLVGVALGRELRHSAGLLLGASMESAVTTVMVGGSAMFFISRTGMPIDASLIGFALALGLCASSSSATSADPDSEPAAAIATRVADLDDVLPIALAVPGFAILAMSTGANLWVMALAPAAIGAGVGVIGWLLFERAESGPERVVFVLGALSLAGGAAAYLHVSPLPVGLVAGGLWTLLPGRVDRVVENDQRRVQHPVVVLLLVTAGASATFSVAAVWLLPPYLLFRLAGKVAGAWIAAPRLDVRSSDLAAFLMPPGVLAVAFALNFAQMLPAGSGQALLATVAFGTAAFELFALFVVPQWGTRGRG